MPRSAYSSCNREDVCTVHKSFERALPAPIALFKLVSIASAGGHGPATRARPSHRCPRCAKRARSHDLECDTLETPARLGTLGEETGLSNARAPNRARLFVASRLEAEIDVTGSAQDPIGYTKWHIAPRGRSRHHRQTTSKAFGTE